MFRVPRTIAKTIDKYIARFIWTGDVDGCGIHWKVWSILTRSKFRRGLGMRSTKEMNRAIVAKSAWRIISQSETLFSRLFLSKYYRQRDFLSVCCATNATWGWRHILWGRDLLKLGLKWRVINEAKIKLKDDWIPKCQNPLRGIYNLPQLLNMRIADLIDVTAQWRELLFKVFFPIMVARKILTIYVLQCGREDHMI